MKTRIMKLIYSVFLFLMISSCGSLYQPGAKESGAQMLDLTSQLRRTSGIQVSGSGENATFKIQSADSIEGRDQPLFVVDNIVYNDYSTVFQMVDYTNFESAKIIRSAQSVAFYGVRAEGGAVEITTKK